MRLRKQIAVATLVAAIAAGTLAGAAAEGKTPAKSAKVKPYPLETCVVTGEKFGGDMGEPITFTYQNQEIKLCCKGCEKEFRKNPAKYVAKIQEAAKHLKPYPLDTCVVTGEKLGGMGEPYVFVHQGREIKLCCKGCLKEFKKDPAKYLKQIEAAEQKGGK
jgi:YHS domain-containing protein